MSTSDLSAPTAGAPTRRPLTASRPRYGEKLIKYALAACAAFSIIVTIGIVFSLIPPAVSFFREVPLSQLFTSTLWSPNFGANAQFGIVVIVVGTLQVVAISLLVAVPTGLLSAIYLSEYASRRVRRVLKPALEILAGIPTVAIGLFAFTFLRPAIEDILPFLNWRGPFSIGVAALAVGLLIVPLVSSVADDAMRSVPRSLRNGAYALGATKMQVTVKVVVPAAISGIVASIVLAGSRAVGETMIVLIAAGAGNPFLSFDPTQGMQTMTSYIAGTATGDIATGTVQYNTIFAVGSLLFITTFALNLLAIRFVRRYREVYE